jgi:hypothetical protein
MLPIGTVVYLHKDALNLSYIAKRRSYTNMYENKKGKVIGYSSTGKVAVEFDDIVFTNSHEKLSSHDNGCHGKGKLHYCWYIPEKFLRLEIENNNILLLL